MTFNKNEYLNYFSLKNKTAFILGGQGRIGKEITKAISAYDAKTIVLDISENNDIGLDGIHCLKFDCSDLENLEINLDLVIKEFGCPDVFINCSYPRSEDWADNSFENISLTSYKKNIDIHLNSYAWLAKLVANRMVKSGKKGSIIQLGSIYGLLGQDLNVYDGTDMKENMSYSIIKGGIINLTRQMASFYGKNGIRVNTICPGGISDSTQNPKFVEQYNKKVPLGRLGDAREIAGAALFLASNGSSYITGANIIIDGGWSAI